jgi:secernin
MCDTFVVLSDATKDGSVLFGKNSDREPNEAQCVVTLPYANYSAGEMVACTYIRIPQVLHTHAVLLSKPFWMWGAEMGSNSSGVTIGNEAVFTRVPYEKEGGLTGMDLLRLALERARSADEGLKVITSLLEEHGQGGNCGFAHPFYYHNSFLIADPRGAWILETVGRQWAAVKVKESGAISNHLTIGEKWDMCSEGLIKDAQERGLYKGGVFNFRKVYSDPLITTFSGAGSRNACTLDYLKARPKNISLRDAMNLLRRHVGDGPGWSPDGKVIGTDVCMHAGFGPVRINQTVGSLVSHLIEGRQIHWVTGTAAPCLSTFKPVWSDAGAPPAYFTNSGTFDEKSLWWQHERLHRQVIHDYQHDLALFKDQREARESGYIEHVAGMMWAAPKERREFSENCVEQDLADTQAWAELVRRQGGDAKSAFYFRSAWKKFDMEANL